MSVPSDRIASNVVVIVEIRIFCDVEKEGVRLGESHI